MALFVCSTAGCGRVTRERKCDACRARKQPRERRDNEQVRRRYRTSRWERLRQLVLERDGHLCQACLATGVTRRGTEIDHITRAMADLERFWDVDNLQTLCKRCHSMKTQRGE